MLRLSCVVIAGLVSMQAASAAAQSTYAQVADIQIGGPLPAQWDYLLADAAGKRLYVSHNAEVVVIDTATDKVVGRIADTPGVHGIAVGAGKVFTSNGREGKVSVVDPKTLATLSKIDSGGANPDAITFDAKTRRSLGVQSHRHVRDPDRRGDRQGPGDDPADRARPRPVSPTAPARCSSTSKTRIRSTSSTSRPRRSWRAGRSRPAPSPTGHGARHRHPSAVRRRRQGDGDDGLDERQGRRQRADLRRHRRHLVRRRHQARVQLLPRRQDHGRQGRRRQDDRRPDASRPLRVRGRWASMRRRTSSTSPRRSRMRPVGGATIRTRSTCWSTAEMSARSGAARAWHGMAR